MHKANNLSISNLCYHCHIFAKFIRIEVVICYCHIGQCYSVPAKKVYVLMNDKCRNARVIWYLRYLNSVLPYHQIGNTVCSRDGQDSYYPVPARYRIVPDTGYYVSVQGNKFKISNVLQTEMLSEGINQKHFYARLRVM